MVQYYDREPNMMRCCSTFIRAVTRLPLPYAAY